MTFLLPQVVSADIFLLEVFMIQSIYLFKKIPVELFKAEITVFFQVAYSGSSEHVFRYELNMESAPN